MKKKPSLCNCRSGKIIIFNTIYVFNNLICYNCTNNNYISLESKFTVSTNGDEEEARRFDSNKNLVDTNSDEVNILIYIL